jgi:hypothetical protein
MCFRRGSPYPNTSTPDRRSATRSSRARLGAAWEAKSETTQEARGWSSHAWRNPSSREEVRFVSEISPPLAFETFFETYCGLGRDGKLTSQGIPKNPLQLAVLLDDMRGTFYSTRAPVAVQEAFLALFGVLASVGRLLGYKARYPEYSGPEEEAPRREGGGPPSDSESTKGDVVVVVAIALLAFVVVVLLRRRRYSSGR